MENIVLGGGCFWCLEAAYQLIKGVTKITSGYSGGETINPSYETVCDGKTGHAEVVEIEYDHTVITLNELLIIFWKIHDPTSLNRQGGDVGTQYRSCIFYLNEGQKKIIETQIKALTENKTFASPIVTQVAPLDIFYVAEEYHQNYYLKHPEQGYCQFVIGPKLSKLKEILDN
ncbi:MAG: peptide-methionine (S)-S-oxide reductase MsrA [candidate division SR1 bacterium]|nr:peptide-methionine (S)-S-oxide reductase MsrA [candidate division SR1 bacterium]